MAKAGMSAGLTANIQYCVTSGDLKLLQPAEIRVVYFIEYTQFLSDDGKAVATLDGYVLAYYPPANRGALVFVGDIILRDIFPGLKGEIKGDASVAFYDPFNEKNKKVGMCNRL